MSSSELWILESLRSDERRTGTELRGAVLDRDATPNRRIDVQLRSPSSSGEFFDDLEAVFNSASAGRHPILHIEAHGNEDCIYLSNGDTIDWTDLSVPLVKINKRLKGNLIITVAACSGGHMARTALSSLYAPFLALVGPETTIFDNELINDYTEFYFEFDKTRSLTKAGWALNAYKKAKQNYYFTTATRFFTDMYGDRMSQAISEKERDNRIDKLVEGLLRSDSAYDADLAREAAERIVRDPKEFLRKAWERFVYIDEYPENEEFFPFPFEKA